MRSCFPEYRVPKQNRRSHGVFVSEMPIKEEKEEEIDEDASIAGLEDLKSDCTMDEDEVRAGNSVETKTTRNFKRNLVEGLVNRRNRRRPPQRGDFERKLKS